MRALRGVATGCAVLLVAGCGLNDGEQKAADDLRAALVVGTPSESTRDQLDCITGRWVGQVGTDTLVGDGLLNSDLSADRDAVRSFAAGSYPVREKTARGYAEAYVSCIDYDEMAEQRSREAGASPEDADEYADCMRAIPKPDRIGAMVDQLTANSGSLLVNQVARQAGDCGRLLK